MATSLDGSAFGTTGAHTYLVDLVSALRRDDRIELVVAASEDGQAWLTQQDDDRSSLRREWVTVGRSRGTQRVIRDFFGCWMWARRSQADAVLYPHEWVPFAGRPTIGVVQNIGFLHDFSRPEFGIRGRALRRLSQLSSRWTTGIVAASAEALDLWTAISKSSRPTPSLVWAPAKVLPRVSHDDSTSIDVLVVAGSPLYKRPRLAVSIERSLRDSGRSTMLIGTPGSPAIPRENVLAAMARASVCVCTSAVETFGYAALESASMGCRVVVGETVPMAGLLDGLVVVASGDDDRNWIAATCEALSRGRMTDDENVVLHERLDNLSDPDRMSVFLRGVVTPREVRHSSELTQVPPEATTG